MGVDLANYWKQRETLWNLESERWFLEIAVCGSMLNFKVATLDALCFFSLGLLGYHTKYDLYGLLWLIFNYDLVIHLLIVIFRDGLLGLPHSNLIMKRQEHLVSTTTDQTTTSLASIGDLHWPTRKPTKGKLAHC
jgi:hypothetical protein